MNSFVRFITVVAFVLIMATSASATNAFNTSELAPVQRTDIGENIAHYTYEVTVDTGPYGKIRLHRFVRDPYPYQPIPNLKGVLFLPGGWATIMGVYATSLSSEHATWDHSLLLYLAKNNIDVWAMDFAWSLIPAERKNFQFMKDWTTVKDIHHAEAALSVARNIRGYTGQGTSKLILIGHSWGGYVGYGVLSEDTQKAANRRNVDAFIALDGGAGFNPDSQSIPEWCAGANELRAMWDSGTYADNLGLILVYFGKLAESDPSGSSPLIEGFTNYQAFLMAAANLFGAYYDESGVVTGLRFTNPEFAMDVYQGFAPYFPVKGNLEMSAEACEGTPVRGLEHINAITVPVFSIASAGDNPDKYDYTFTLIQSSDKTYLRVQLLSDEEQAFDFGHAEFFTAGDAETLVWYPMLDWINAH